MSVLESWSRASPRTNVVRLVAGLVAVAVGAEASALATMLFLFTFFTGDFVAASRAAVALAGLTAMVVGVIHMPALDARERLLTIGGTALAIVAAVPGFWEPADVAPPRWQWFVGAGALVIIELTRQAFEDPAGASPTGSGAAPSLDDEGAVEADGHRDVEAVG